MDLPIANRWFPIPQRLETAPGHHRFIWNLAWGTSGVEESRRARRRRRQHPARAQGRARHYTLELSVDGKALPAQPLTVTMDPRSKATTGRAPAELRLPPMRSSPTPSQARRALAEIESVKGSAHQEQLPHSADRRAAEDRCSPQLTALPPELGGARIGLGQANTELTSALNVAESSDRAIPSQALAVYAEAKQASAARVKEWTALKQGPSREVQSAAQVREACAHRHLRHRTRGLRPDDPVSHFLELHATTLPPHRYAGAAIADERSIGQAEVLVAEDRIVFFARRPQRSGPCWRRRCRGFQELGRSANRR
jgi:hypothetical protein